MVSTIKTNSIIGFLLFLMLAVFACESVSTITVDDTLLLNCWKYSYEEDEDDDRIYRPCDSRTFPLSRYRNQFTLEASGIASYLVLSPDDSHFGESGTWSYESNIKTLTILNNNGEEYLKFIVEELSKDRAKLKKI